jgi:hypothetical protein
LTGETTVPGTFEIDPGVEDVGVRALTSSIPPPEVTSCFSPTFFPQKLHRLFVDSSCTGASTASVSGSPRRDRLVHPTTPLVTPRPKSSWRRVRRTTGMWRREEEGLGFGRERADW